jgi:SAM-dependent methyltransferase
MEGMRDFRHRSDEPELMDQGGISFAEFHQCLQSLETINRLTLAYRPTLRWLRGWLKSGEPIVLLDVGSGGGDMLRRISKQTQKQEKKSGAGINHSMVSFIGVDLNPWAKKSAELNSSFMPGSSSSPASSIRYATADIFNFEPDQPIDIIICSLFTHHLTDTQLVEFLRWIDHRASKGWFINDLHRHPLPYYFIKITTRLLSRNRLIRNDAAVSVARSFTVADWRRLLKMAGIDDRVRLQWFFPFRLCLSCREPHA